MKACILTLVAVLLTPALVFAGTTCGTASPLRGDGDSTKFDFVAPTTANYYQFPASIGRSYSVQVTMVYDDTNPDVVVTAFTDTACSVALTGTVSTINANPGLPTNSTRFSFTAVANETVYLKVLNNNASVGRYIDILSDETTQENVRWATAQGYLTVYGVKNTTSQIAHVTMAATTDSGGTGTTTVNLTIQPGQRSLVALGPGLTINVPAGLGGYTLITHDLPKGGVVVDAYFANSTSLVPAVVIAPR